MEITTSLVAAGAQWSGYTTEHLYAQDGHSLPLPLPTPTLKQQ